MGRQRVPLDKISWSLTPSSIPDNLEPLAESMREHGIKHRPLLNKDFRCIDGARQLEVLRQWGETEVDAIVTDDLEFSIKVLAQRHDSKDFPPGVCRHDPLSAQRIGRFHEELKPQVAIRIRKIRTFANKARGKNVPSRPNLHYRPAMAKALGLSAESVYDNSLYLAQALQESSGEELTVALQAAHDLETGVHSSVYYAYGAVRRWREQNQAAAKLGTVEEQRDILNNTLSMLGGIAPALTPVMELREGHDPAEISQWLDQIRAFNRISTRLTRSLLRSNGQ